MAEHSSLGTYLLRRIVNAGITLFFASIIVFLLIRMVPGDPVSIMYGRGRMGSDVSRERLDELRNRLGFDRPFHIQYVRWMERAVRLDLGRSVRTLRPVTQELGLRLPATLLLIGITFLFQALFIGAGGIIAFLYANRLPDKAIRMAAVTGVSLPPFWLGLILLQIFAVRFKWISVGGEADIARTLLPAFTLAVFLAPQPMRVFRAQLISESSRLHALFAEAKGIPGKVVLFRYLIPQAVLPVLTLMGMSLSWLIGGTVIVEIIFSWPGLGRYIIESIHFRDYPVIQGYVMGTTICVVLIQLFIDILHVLIDPRIKIAESR